MAVTLADIEKLDPGNSPDVNVALTFLRLVVRNNPNKTAAELMSRPDVQSALSVVDTWFDTAAKLVSPAILQSPLVPDGNTATQAAGAALADLHKTLAKMRSETRFTDSNVSYWKTQEPHAEQSWTAKLLLRMGWFTRFLAALLGLTTPRGAVSKTWVSRLAPNTCSYCRRLHGVTIPVSESFAGYAVAAGWAKPYGGLYGPPLHPSCQCWLEFST